MNHLDFRPLPGLSSCHLQTILASVLKPQNAPPTTAMLVALGKGDFLACEVSKPVLFTKIVVLVHGLGGSHESNYMVRMARRCYENGIMAVRVNLRACGSGKDLSSLPYNGGRSDDVLAVLEQLKGEYPHSEICLVGFSLGANIVLKLAGELEERAPKTIAVCPPLDLGACVEAIQKRRHALYHAYYVKKLREQGKRWLKGPIRSIYEFDDVVTAPLWGFSGAKDYYAKSSAIHYLSRITCDCSLLFAEDDPFIPNHLIQAATSCNVRLYVTKHGGHMGFLGYTAKEYNYHWMDQQLMNWLK